MHDDDPDDVVHNLFAAAGVGRQPAGPPDRRHRRRRSPRSRATRSRASTGATTGPRNMVVAAAGNVDHTAVVRLVRTAFGRNGFLAGDEPPVVPPRPRAAVRRVHARRPLGRRGPSSRSTWCSASTGFTRHDDRRYALGVLNTALGGGTSSRLFQEVRERRGLAYSVFSFASHHADAGLVGVSVGCLPAPARRRARDGPRRAARRSRPRASPTRSSSAARASCAAGWCSASRTPAPGCRASARPSWSTTSCSRIDEVIARVDAVTLDDVRAVAAALFTQPEILAVVGPAR